MLAPNGKYDALVFAVALPKAVVRQMLPLWLQDNFLPIPDQVYRAFDLERHTPDGEETHIIILQLGYQHGTGPMFMGFNFHEAKIDVPFLKHYYRRHLDNDQKAFVYKQVMCVFSSVGPTADSL